MLPLEIRKKYDVALRKEGVDRNLLTKPPAGGLENVALRKEGVDRN